MKDTEIIYENIIEVQRLYKEEMVNKYLKLGWTLLKVLTQDYGDTGMTHENAVYIIGWDTTKGQVRIPEDEYKLPF